MKTTRTRLGWVFLLLLVATVGRVQANVIVEFTGGSTTFGAGDFTVGFTFETTTPVTVDGLAFWDESGDGLASSHDVGLWTAGGTLLASSTVSNASAVEASSSGLGNWLVEGIPSLPLGVGSYVLGGVQTNSIGGDLLRLNATATAAPGIVYGTTMQNTANGLVLTMPDSAVSSVDDGAWGPNLRLASAAMPEPSALSLFALGLGAIALRRRRR